MLDEDRIKELIIEALAEKPAQAYKVDNKTKSVSEVVKEKSLSFKDNNDGTLSSSRELALKGKSTESARTKGSYRPTESQLKKINQNVTLIDKTSEPGSGFVFTLQATNLKGAPDLSFEGFSEAANKQMAEIAVAKRLPYLVASKSDCEDHTWKAINQYGSVIDAWVDKGALFYDIYVPENKSTSEILDRIFDGQLSKLSVGFSMSYADVTCNSCKNKSIVDESCPHYPGEPDEKGKTVTMTIEKIRNNYEISGVAVPCQEQAHIQNNPSGSKSIKSLKPLDIESIKLMIGSVEIPVEELAAIEEVQAADEEFAESVEKINEIGKISNDNTEVNLVMDEPVVEKELDKVEAVEKAEDVVNVGLTEERLCKVAENIKNQVVAELKVELASFMEEIKTNMPVAADLAPVLAELAEIKSQLTEAKAELELSKSVPVSASAKEILKTAVEPVQYDPLNVSTDSMIVY